MRLIWGYRNAVERGMSDFLIFWCKAYCSRLFEFLCMIITALISCRAGTWLSLSQVLEIALFSLIVGFKDKV